MKHEHRMILAEIEKYLDRPGAHHLRFWQALYNCGIIQKEINSVDLEWNVSDDYNLSDEALLKRIKNGNS